MGEIFTNNEMHRLKKQFTATGEFLPAENKYNDFRANWLCDMVAASAKQHYSHGIVYYQAQYNELTQANPKAVPPPVVPAWNFTDTRGSGRRERLRA